MFVTWSFLAYMFSPQIGYDKHAWWWVKADEKTKKEFGIDSLYQTTDRETNTLVRLVSWLADSSSVDSLIKLYWHKEAFDTLYLNTPRDTLMYRCLAEVLMSLYNPHMWFHWDYKRDILWDALWYDNTKVSAKVDEFSATMQVGNIKNIGIFADTLDYRKKQDSIQIALWKPPLTDEEFTAKLISLNKTWAKYIANKIFAEAWHIRWIHREWVIRYYMNYFGDYIKSWFKQKSLYEQPWSQENRTHNEDIWWWQWEEWILIAQFLQLYENNMPANSIRHLDRLITFYETYFGNYTDTKKSALYREKVAVLKRKVKEEARLKQVAIEKRKQEKALQDSIQRAQYIPQDMPISPTKDSLQRK